MLESCLLLEAVAHRQGTDKDIGHWSTGLEVREEAQADLERGGVVLCIADKYYYTG